MLRVAAPEVRVPELVVPGLQSADGVAAPAQRVQVHARPASPNAAHATEYVTSPLPQATSPMQRFIDDLREAARPNPERVRANLESLRGAPERVRASSQQIQETADTAYARVRSAGATAGADAPRAPGSAGGLAPGLDVRLPGSG